MSVGAERARLSYEELYQLKWMVGGLLALVSLWTMAYLEVRGGALLFLTGATVVATLLWPRLPARIPSAVWKAVTPILILVIVTDFLLSKPDIIAPLVRMIILLVLVRSLQYRRRREDLQLILLCLFMVVISGVLTLSLTFALQILIFTPCAMCLLFVINLTESFDRKNEVPAGLWDEFRFRRFAGRVVKVFDLRILCFGVLIFAGVVVVSSFFFVLIPRFRLDQAMPFLNLRGKARSGFSDSIKFGDVIEIIEDDSVALRVDLPSGQNIPVDPFWRMVVLDEYHNRSFQMSFSAKRNKVFYLDNKFRRPGEPSPTPRVDSEKDRWIFYLEGGISKYLPTVGLFGRLRFQTRKSYEYKKSLHVFNTTSIGSSVLFYQIESMEPMSVYPPGPDDEELLDLGVLALAPRNDTLHSNIKYPQTTLVVPGDRANFSVLRKVVAEITRGERLSSREFSARAARYLNARHGYSLNVAIPPGGGDEIIRWLQSDQPGHCELFAGSFTLLARSAGFPTRVVTGFKGGVWNDIEKYYMIRNSDAHAWCEIYDRQEGWIRVDPTPGSGLTGANAMDSALAGRLNRDVSWRAYLDSLRILWYRRIVNFDEEQQTEIAAQLKSVSTEYLTLFKMILQLRLQALRAWFFQPWGSAKWLQMGVFLTAAVFVVLVWRYADVWISKMGLRGRLFGFEIFRDRVRRQAGKLVVKFREKGLKFKSDRGISEREWDEVYGQLLALRFGEIQDRPEAKPIFRYARRLLK